MARRLLQQGQHVPGNMDIKTIIAVVLVAVGVLFDIIGFAIPYWRYSKVESVSVYSGLWTYCSDPGKCSTLPSASEYFMCLITLLHVHDVHTFV